MICLPVFSDENGIPQISMYVEDDDGSFRRTQYEPLRLLRDDIKGISISQGDIVSVSYDRYEREWNTPTVTFHYGRPQSFYQFLRGKVARNRFFVFTKPQLAGHISKLSLHELQLKTSASQRKVAILKEKYMEAVKLWSQEELEIRQEKKNSPAPPNNLLQADFSLRNRRGDERLESHRGAIPLNSANTPGKVAYFQRDSLSGHSGRQKFGKPSTTDFSSPNPVERDFNKRKNLVQEFSLTIPQQDISTQHKDQNKHFLKRFLYPSE